MPSSHLNKRLLRARNLRLRIQNAALLSRRQRLREENRELKARNQELQIESHQLRRDLWFEQFVSRLVQCHSGQIYSTYILLLL